MHWNRALFLSRFFFPIYTFRAILAFCEFMNRAAAEKARDLASFLLYSILRPHVSAALSASEMSAHCLRGGKSCSQPLSLSRSQRKALPAKSTPKTVGDKSWPNGFCAPGGDYNNSTPNELCNFQDTKFVRSNNGIVDTQRKSAEVYGWYWYFRNYLLSYLCIFSHKICLIFYYISLIGLSPNNYINSGICLLFNSPGSRY